MVCTQDIGGALSCLLCAILFGYVAKSSLSPQVMGIASVLALCSCLSCISGTYSAATGDCSADKK